MSEWKRQNEKSEFQEPPGIKFVVKIKCLRAEMDGSSLSKCRFFVHTRGEDSESFRRCTSTILICMIYDGIFKALLDFILRVVAKEATASISSSIEWRKKRMRRKCHYQRICNTKLCIHHCPQENIPNAAAKAPE